jgi:hypothetical protein
MVMRRIDRGVALVLALALTGAGVLAGIETMLLVLGRPPLVVPRHQWAQDLRSARWDSDIAVITSAVALAFGVALVMLQLAPRRPVRLPGRKGSGRMTWVSRRGLARRLAWDVQQFEPVGGAHVHVGRSRVSVRLRAGAGTDTDALAEAARASAGASVDALGVGALGPGRRITDERRPLRWKVRVDLEPVPADATTARRGRRRKT